MFDTALLVYNAASYILDFTWMVLGRYNVMKIVNENLVKC